MLDKFKLDNPEVDVPVALEQLRGSFNAQIGKEGATEEQVEKLARDVTDVLAKVEEHKKELRDALRTAPPPADDAKSVKLDRSAMVFAPGSDDKSDKDFGPAMRDLNNVHLSLLVAPVARLTDDAPTTKKIVRFRYLSDMLTLINMREHEVNPNYRGWETLPQASEYKALAKQFSGALSDATAHEGAEFVPTSILSGAIYDRIAINLQVANLFETFPMVAPVVKRGFRGSKAVSYFGGEQTSDTGTSYATASTINTDDQTFTASKQYCLALETEEWEQDAIVGANFVMDEMGVAMADKKEATILNSNLTTTFDAGTVEDEMYGLRDALVTYLAASGKSAVDMSGGMTAEALAEVWGAMGALGQVSDGAWICETNGLARLMVAKNSDGIPLWNALGAQGPAVTGSIGQVFGRPVIVSSHVPTTLNNSGVIPSSAGSKTAIYHVCCPAFKIGERLGVQVAYSDHYRFAYGQRTFRGISRWVFRNLLPAATNRIINGGFGIATY